MDCYGCKRSRPASLWHSSVPTTSLIGNGGTFKIRFGTVASEWFLHQGVDNVSILMETPDPPATVPAPGALLLAFLGTGCITCRRRG
jgi:hypothetical protein